MIKVLNWFELDFGVKERFTIMQRCFACNQFELPVKIGNILKATLEANVGNAFCFGRK
jgi:hypothetical protein